MLKSEMNLTFLKFSNTLKIGYNFHDLLNYAKFHFKKYKSEKKISNTVLLKTFVISLPFRIDRRENIIKEFSTHKISFEFHDAIHGKKYRSVILETMLSYFKTTKYLSDGSIGCIASHLQLWNNLINSKFDTFLIFEDDIKFETNMQPIDNIVKTLPHDFDLVYLGSKSITSCMNMKKVSLNLYKPFCISKGSHSYFISKSGAVKILNVIKEIEILCGSIDSILGILMIRNKINCYHFLPSFTKIDSSSESNIFNIHDLQKKIHKSELI